MRRLMSLATLIAAAVPTSAQQLADRVASVRNGEAYFSYASRPDVCGDGHILMLHWLDQGPEQVVFFDNGMSMGNVDLGRQRCNTGPARVQLSVSEGQVTQLQPAVGGGRGHGQDLGTFGTKAAVDYLIDLGRRATYKDVSHRALLAAAIADSSVISERLVTIADDQRLHAANREAALQWIGWTAERENNTAADAHVRAIATDESDDPDVRERAIRVVVLPDGQQFLEDLYTRVTHTQLKERIIRVLGERPSKSGNDWIERVARNTNERVELRERAIRALGEDQHEVRRVRALYETLTDPELKDRAIRVIGESGDADGIAWIKLIVMDRSEPVEARERALRVLGESESVPTSYLVSLYDSLGDPDLKLRLIKVLAERDDGTARAKLADIAQRDPDPDFRKKARRARE